MRKWFLTSLMLIGACITSWELHPYWGLVFLTLGNAGWAIQLVVMKEWAAMTVFVIMCIAWLSGLIKYLFF